MTRRAGLSKLDMRTQENLTPPDKSQVEQPKNLKVQSCASKRQKIITRPRIWTNLVFGYNPDVFVLEFLMAIALIGISEK